MEGFRLYFSVRAIDSEPPYPIPFPKDPSPGPPDPW